MARKLDYKLVTNVVKIKTTLEQFQGQESQKREFAISNNEYLHLWEKYEALTFDQYIS